MKILTFNEYRIAQALYLQTQVKELSHSLRNLDQILLTCYIQYLSICGVEESILQNLRDLVGSLNPERKGSGTALVYNEQYSQELVDDIQKGIDKFLTINNKVKK